MTRRVPAGLLAVLAATLVAAAPAPASVIVGMGDQKPAMFTDPRFLALGIDHVRLTVGWDVLTSDWQTQELTDWLFAARLAGAQPLISFGHSRTPGMRRVLPTPERFRYEFRRFRARFPWVTDFSTWNEANHCGEPTCHRPGLVAAYWRALQKECPECTVLAAEVLDLPNMADWVVAFRVYSRSEPAYWGLHDYVDVNRLHTSGTRRLLTITRGEIWLTEVGGIVARHNNSAIRFEESPAHAAEALGWLFDRIVPLSPRITRVYVYHWNGTSAEDTWDSALVGPDDLPRPALGVLEQHLALLGRR